jgi:hypothetical protein
MTQFNRAPHPLNALSTTASTAWWIRFSRTCGHESCDPADRTRPSQPSGNNHAQEQRRAGGARSHLLWRRLIRKGHKDLASTSPSASLYEAFPAPEARWRVERFMALHSKARQLARSGGVRVRRSIVPMLLPPHPRQTNPHRRQRCLGARPQCQPRQGKLALHHPQRTHQTQGSIPFNLNPATSGAATV